MFGARIKIMWEEQLVDPPIAYLIKAGIINDDVILGVSIRYNLK